MADIPEQDMDTNRANDTTSTPEDEIRAHEMPTNASYSTERYGNSKVAALVVLTLANFCYGVSIALYGPFFPREAELKGTTPTVYGLTFGIYQLTIIISVPLVGKLLGSVSPKLIFCVGTFTAGTCVVLFGILDMCPSGVPFIGLAFAIRFVEGLGAASMKIAGYAIIASHFSSRMTKIFASVDTFFAVGFVTGPIVGGALHDAEGFSFPFYVAGGLTALAGVCASFLLPSIEEVKKLKPGNLGAFWKNPGIIIYFFIVFATFNYTGFLQVTLEPHLREFKLSGVFLGLIFPISGFTHALTSPGWEWLESNGFNNLLLTVLAALASISSQLLVGPAPFIHFEQTVGIVVAALALKGLGSGGKLICSFDGALRDTVARGFPNDVMTHGLVSSMYFLSVSFGAFVGPSLGGFLFDSIGFRNSTLVFFGIEVLGMIIVFIYAFNRNWKRAPIKIGSAEEHQPILDQEHQNT